MHVVYIERRYSNLREYWIRVPPKVGVSTLHSSGEPRRKLEDIFVEIEPPLYFYFFHIPLHCIEVLTGNSASVSYHSCYFLPGLREPQSIMVSLHASQKLKDVRAKTSQ